MTMKLIAIAATLATLGGCAARTDGLEPPRRAGDMIRFSASRCFGACPAYSVQVSPDGSALLEPERFTAVPGPTRFTISAAQYRRLVTALAPHRPATGTTKVIDHDHGCQRFATDMPGYVVEWTRPGQAATRLHYQGGCMDPQYGRLRVAIASVPKILDIETMLNPKAVSPPR